MAQGPPANPGTMTPESKAALGSRLGLETSPDPRGGPDVVGDGDLSGIGPALTAVNSRLSEAYGEYGGVRDDVRDIILASPAGSTATEGYHLAQQAEAINDQGHLDVGPVPDRPTEERA